MSSIGKQNFNFSAKLQEKSEKEFEDLSTVTPLIQDILFNKKLGKRYSGYVDRLKKDSEIIINDELVEKFEKLLGK